MARKPTRFWHPAQRALRRTRERVAALRSRNERPTLESLRPRLQHYMRAMYGEGVVLEALSKDAQQSAMLDLVIGTMSAGGARAMSESEAGHIRLPMQMPTSKKTRNIAALEQYRVLAVQHAERIVRGTAEEAETLNTDLERDLFEIAESVSIDAHIRELQPGLSAALDVARAAALTERPKRRAPTDIEQRVDAMLPGLGALRDHVATNSAAENAQWARAVARAMEIEFGLARAREYRRIRELTLWGTSIVTRGSRGEQSAEKPQLPSPPKKTFRIPTGRKGQSPSGVPSKRKGPTSNAKSSPNVRDGTPTGEAGENKSEEQSTANDDRSPGGAEGASSASQSGNSDREGAAPDKSKAGDIPLEGVVHHYPEWDCYTQGLRATGTLVRVAPAPLSSAESAASLLLDNAAQVRKARRQFERLRSHRARLRRQVHGDELDLEACVEWMVDRRMGVAPSDRLYTTVRPGRRELAITLLIDASASTLNEVNETQKVIDVERIAALIATAAFDALGDDYSILTFSSASANNVRVSTLKAFGEPSSPRVQQRIGAIVPSGTTRLGAAIRHATAELATHPAPHRLLLVVSDGKPYDYDWYFVDYAVQDSRHATMSARLAGVHPFCITVDRSEGEDYLSTIFGAGGYRVVRRPEDLPHAMLMAVQQMIRP